MNEQLSFDTIGNLVPCPYKDTCINVPAGCNGERYWCRRYEPRFKENYADQQMTLKEWEKIT